MKLDLCSEQYFEGDSIKLAEGVILTLPPISLQISENLIKVLQTYNKKKDPKVLEKVNKLLFDYLNTNREGIEITEEYLIKELKFNAKQSEALLTYFISMITGIEKK